MSLIVSILLVVFGIIPAILISLVFIHRYLTKSKVPFPANTYAVQPKTWKDKFFGQVYRLFIENHGTALVEWRDAAVKEGKEVIAFTWTNSATAVIPLHEEDMNYLLLGEGAPFVVKHADYAVLEPYIGKYGLLTIRDPKIHLQQRRLVTPAFSQKTINNTANYVVPTFSAELHKEISKALEGEEGSGKKTTGLSLNGFFDKFALNVIVKGSFNTLKSASVDIGECFEHMMSVIGFSLQDRLPLWLGQLLPTKKNKIFRKYKPRIWQACDEAAAITRKKQQEREEHGDQNHPNTILDCLVKEKALGTQQIRDHLVLLLLAGEETSSKALTWISIHLSRNPAVQQKLLEELEEVIALNIHPSIDELTDCKYLEFVIREGLRLNPPAPQFGVETTKELTLPHSKVVLPPGIRILFSLFLTHRSKAIYGNDAEEFRPERWEEPELIAKYEKFKSVFMPFSLGRRSCIGEQMAMSTLKIGVAALVRSFKLSWPEGQEMCKMAWRVTLKPEPDPKIILEHRLE